jgi:hypothetical protein
MITYQEMLGFARPMFDRPEWCRTGGHILQAILKARSPRLTDVAYQMPGRAPANYKAIQRFLAKVDPRELLLRLFQADAPFVIADPTEIPRPQARKTSYVGVLKDGKTRGFWLLTLATPYRGRAIPFAFVTYSSRTIEQEETSRNRYHFQVLACIKALVGDTPIVFDREFSYLALLQAMHTEGMNYVIRLREGSHPPVLVDREGRRVALSLRPQEERVIGPVLYQGQVPIQLMGRWQKGFSEPLWIMTNLEDPRRGFQIYQGRMKIEEAFRDLKSLLGLDKIMNQRQEHMEKMVALAMLAYGIGLWVGETLRDHLYGPPESQDSPSPHPASKRRLYSGLFILLRRSSRLPPQTIRPIVSSALQTFPNLVYQPVRTHV